MTESLSLPPGFERTLDRVCRPLAQRAAALREQLGRTVIIGLCGAQGSGKSTIAAVTCELLNRRSLAARAVSLDDLYLDRAARERLAREVHPLLATRGPPGTHLVNLGHETLDQLAGSGHALLPAFNKADDRPRPRASWHSVETPIDIVIFEGWCVGSTAQDVDSLKIPINALERDEDPNGIWRRFVNGQLAGPYRRLFDRLDALIFLQAPGFGVVAGWRAEAEDKLRARTGGGMAPEEISRFVAHYERLTRWMLAEMPGRADWTIPLGADRQPFP